MLVRVENLTQKTTIMRGGTVVDKPWGRMQGLSGTICHLLGDGRLIVPSSGLESMFTSPPIDVLYMDDSHRIQTITERVVPNTVGTQIRHYQYIVEVPVGTIACTKSTVGDLLQLVFLGASVQVAADQFREQ